MDELSFGPDGPGGRFFVRTGVGTHLGWLPVSVEAPAAAGGVAVATARELEGGGSSVSRAGSAEGADGGSGGDGGTVEVRGGSSSGEGAGLREGGSLTITASVESEDRSGDVIVASGWRLDAYRENPVVLWAHQYHLPPIARSTRVWVEGDSLKASIEFAGTSFAQEVLRLYATGFMRGVSVGFRALEIGPRGSGSGGGTIFRRQELLEISAAPVPLHPGTLAAGAESSGAGAERRMALDALRDLVGVWRGLGELVGGRGV